MSTDQHLTVEPVDTAARIALRQWIGKAKAVGIDVDDPGTMQDVYDAYFAKVAEQDPSEREDPTERLTTIAMAVGEYLQRTTCLQWRVVTDAQGRDLALYREIDGTVMFPIDPVAGAWQQQEAGWLAGFVTAVQESVGT